MENFDWTSFTRKIAIKAPIETMYDAWAKASEIERWFLSNANYFDTKHNLQKKEIKAEKYFTYEWNWFLYEMTEKGRIVEANGNHFFQFTFAGNCIVDIEFTAQEEYTIVTLTQKNIPTDDAAKRGIRLGCDTGWCFYLLNLKSVYEGGLDLRNKNPDFQGMLNS